MPFADLCVHCTLGYEVLFEVPYWHVLYFKLVLCLCVNKLDYVVSILYLFVPETFVVIYSWKQAMLSPSSLPTRVWCHIIQQFDRD